MLEYDDPILVTNITDREQELSMSLDHHLDDWITKNNTHRSELKTALLLLCRIIFVHKTPFENSEKSKEIDNFCYCLQKYLKKE